MARTISGTSSSAVSAANVGAWCGPSHVLCWARSPNGVTLLDDHGRGVHVRMRLRRSGESRDITEGLCPVEEGSGPGAFEFLCDPGTYLVRYPGSAGFVGGRGNNVAESCVTREVPSIVAMPPQWFWLTSYFGSPGTLPIPERHTHFELLDGLADLGGGYLLPPGVRVPVSFLPSAGLVLRGWGRFGLEL